MVLIYQPLFKKTRLELTLKSVLLEVYGIFFTLHANSMLYNAYNIY